MQPAHPFCLDAILPRYVPGAHLRSFGTGCHFVMCEVFTGGGGIAAVVDAPALVAGDGDPADNGRCGNLLQRGIDRRN